MFKKGFDSKFHNIFKIICHLVITCRPGFLVRWLWAELGLLAKETGAPLKSLGISAFDYRVMILVGESSKRTFFRSNSHASEVSGLVDLSGDSSLIDRYVVYLLDWVQ